MCTFPRLFVPIVWGQCFYLVEVAFYGLFSYPLQLGPTLEICNWDVYLNCQMPAKNKLTLRMDPLERCEVSNLFMFCPFFFSIEMHQLQCSKLKFLASALSNVSMVCPPYLSHYIMVLCIDYLS